LLAKSDRTGVSAKKTANLGSRIWKGQELPSARTADGWLPEQRKRELLAAGLTLPASVLCLYLVRAVVNVLKRRLPPKVADTLFAPTPRETVGQIGVDPVNVRQLLAIAFLLLYGRHLYHSVRGWIRRSRRRSAQSLDSVAVGDTESYDGPQPISDIEGLGRAENPNG